MYPIPGRFDILVNRWMIAKQKKLLDWIEFYKIDWSILHMNSAAIDLLEKNPDKINWWLSFNPDAIHLLEKNFDKIDWDALSTNPAAIDLLEKNPDDIYWKIYPEILLLLI